MYLASTVQKQSLESNHVTYTHIQIHTSTDIETGERKAWPVLLVSDAQIIKRLITQHLAGLLDDTLIPVPGTGHYLKALIGGSFKRYDAFSIREMIRAYIGKDSPSQKEEDKLRDAVHGETSQKVAGLCFLSYLQALLDFAFSEGTQVSDTVLMEKRHASRRRFPQARTQYSSPPTVEDVVDLDEHETFIAERMVLAHTVFTLREQKLFNNVNQNEVLDEVAFSDYVLTHSHTIEHISVTWREYLTARIILDQLFELTKKNHFVDDLARLVFEELRCIVGLFICVRTKQDDEDAFIAWFKLSCSMFWVSPRSSYHIVSLAFCELLCKLESKQIGTCCSCLVCAEEDAATTGRGYRTASSRRT